MRLLLILAALLFATPALAQSRLDEILTSGTIRVGLPGDYQPFAMRDKDTGTYTGLDVDMANNLASTLKVKVEFVPTTWSTLLTDLNDDKFDIGMGGITITLARQRTAFFSAPVVRTGKAPIARCFDMQRFITLADIDKPGVKVIVNPGGTNEAFDRANLHQAQIVVFPDNTKIFDALAAGDADVMITDSIEAKIQQKLHQELCAIHPDEPFDFEELGYLLPRDIDLKLYVDQWLHQLTGTGVLETERRKWIGP